MEQPERSTKPQNQQERALHYIQSKVEDKMQLSFGRLHYELIEDKKEWGSLVEMMGIF
jgi:hypothetical protein